MADFDPDAFLAKVEAPAPSGGGFDPDAFLAKTAPDAAPPPGPSLWERAKALGSSIGAGAAEVGRGALGTVTGFADTALRAKDQLNQVIAHPIDTLGDERFRAEAMRGVNDNIPFGNRLAEAVGGPPAESPSDAAAFPNARAAGNMAGLAVPLPIGETASALMSGARKVAGRVATAAEDRMVNQGVKDIAGSKATGISKPTDRRQIAKAIDSIKDELREPGAIAIADTARQDPAEALSMVHKKVDDLTNGRKAAYQVVDNATGGIHVGDLRRALGSEIARLGKAPGQATERAAVEAMVSDIDKTWGGQKSPLVPTIEMRKYVTRLQTVAADTMGGLEETRRVKILDHVSGLAKDFLDAHLDAAAKADPLASEAVADLKQMNRKVSAWLTLDDALRTRAGKLETNAMVDTRGKSLAGGLAAAGAAAHFLHSPGAAAVAAGAGALPYVAPVVDRAVTRGAQRLPDLLGRPGVQTSSIPTAAVAKLLQAARAGASRAELQAQAQQNGVPVEIADNIAQQRGM